MAKTQNDQLLVPPAPPAIPSPLFQILEEEAERLNGIPVPAGGYFFKQEDFVCIEALAQKIDRTAELSFKYLDAETRAAAKTLAQKLQSGDSSEAEKAAFVTTLTKHLNHLLTSRANASQLAAQVDDPLLLKDVRELLVTELNSQEGEYVKRLVLEKSLHGFVKKIEDLRLAQLYRSIHQNPEPRTALCLSGGGIRSATFALGILQGLARKGLLDKFDYLSTVSGGGYIGSWFSTWISRHGDGVRGVVNELKGRQRESPQAPESGPIQYLRTYSNFLSPRVGLFSVDMWTLVGTFLRNLILIWLVLIPLLLAVLFLPRAYAALLSISDPAEWLKWTVLSLGSCSAALALAFVSMKRPALTDAAPEKHLRSLMRSGKQAARKLHLGRLLQWCTEAFEDAAHPQRKFFWLGLCPMLLATFCLTVWWAWVRDPAQPFESQPETQWWRWALFGVVTHLLGWIGYRLYLGHWWHARKWSYVGEVLLVLGSGAIGGALLWCAAKEIFPRPVTHTFLYTADAQATKVVANIQLHVDWPSSGGTSAAPAGTTVAKPTNLIFQAAIFATNEGGSVVATALPIGTKVSGENWNPGTELYACLAAPLFIGLFLLAATAYIGLSSRSQQDKDLEWWARVGAWFLIAAVIWGSLNAVVFFGPILFFLSSKLVTLAGGLSGLFTLLFGASRFTPARSEGPEGKSKRWTDLAVKLAAPVALILSFAGLSLLTSLLLHSIFSSDGLSNSIEKLGSARPFAGIAEVWGDDLDNLQMLLKPEFYSEGWGRNSHWEVVQLTPFWLALMVLLLLLVMIWVLARKIKQNRFSLHGTYRARLMRAYLGASRRDRRPNWFTGFDEADNVEFSHLRPGFLQVDHLQNRDGLIAELTSRAVKNANSSFASRLRAALELLDPRLCMDIDRQSAASRPSASLVENLVRTLNLMLGADPPSNARNHKKLVQFTAAFRAVFPSPIRSDADILARRRILDRHFTGLIVPIAESGLAGVQDGEEPALPIRRPMHVVNVALNLVEGDNLAWQERKADSFTISPLHCGNRRLGYRRADTYGRGPRSAISVATAMTISGAAASPNMGYHSSSAVAFLLTLFKVRLGWWLGNPGQHGQKTYQDWAPADSVTPLLNEALGRTNDKNPYVYLSDGGHFDNLGLYEMVQRRCGCIVVSDAGADPQCALGDLGSAVRKIRIDLGLRISYEQFLIKPRRNEPAGKYCAVGTIHYEDVDEGAQPGVLIYLKPALCKTEPRDVLHYSAISREFPHEPTADQFFTESQFESYRALGAHVIEQICGSDWPTNEEEQTLVTFRKAVKSYLAFI